MDNPRHTKTPEAGFLNAEELSLIKSSPQPPQLPGFNSTQLFGPMNSSKISPPAGR